MRQMFLLTDSVRGSCCDCYVDVAMATICVNIFKMASSVEEAITWLLNNGRVPLALDEGLRSLIEDYFFEGDDELPRGRYFTHVDRKLL